MTSFDPNVSIVAGAAIQSAKPQTRQTRRKNASERAVQLGREYVEIVQKAQQEQPDNHSEIVRQAKELFLSGHFDTYQAAREAAQKIVEYGI
jgi:type II secretory pathway pseudopilin PulG